MSIISRTLRAGLATAALIIAVGTASAHEYKLGELHIGHPWARASVNVGGTAGAFLTVENHGSAPDRLVAVSTPVAEVAEIHESFEDKGVMRMRRVEGVEIPAGGEAKLAPGGYHIMLIKLKQAIMPGEKVPATLTFEKAGTIDVELAIEKPGAGADMGHDMKKMDHSAH
ncbi:copper chaperone PCu(A)C [Tistrella mobilis]|uniref:copper chaperone PCu(A)C n=1 Tax=Tistrella mobilis TaxID=171437 RepID=UPI00355681A3